MIVFGGIIVILGVIDQGNPWWRCIMTTMVGLTIMAIGALT